MKLKICRASGLPVKYEEIEQFKKAQGELYDKVRAHVLGSGGSLMTEQEADRMNRLLTRLERSALARFKTVDEITLKGTKKEWLALVAQHGPIAMAKALDTGALTLIIMDATFGG